ncbi:MAG: dethiobiotin synthase [Anaeromyxobacteraceae bacterium]
MRGLFVTGTDTGVGKTEVSCALLEAARATGVDAVGMKPAQSGVTSDEPSDAQRLREASGRCEPLEALCPYTFEAPLAPAVAARLAGVTIAVERIEEAARALAARHATVLVEGAGGLLVPLTDELTYADLAARLGLPVLVVARAGLGTVNHTALTVEAILRRGLRLAGIVLNRTTPTDDPSVPHNASEIARITTREPIAILPYEADIEARGRALRSILRGKIQF